MSLELGGHPQPMSNSHLTDLQGEIIGLVSCPDGRRKAFPDHLESDRAQDALVSPVHLGGPRCEIHGVELPYFLCEGAALRSKRPQHQ